MSQLNESKNRFLAKISVAARTALAHPRNVELAQFIGAGPSIRARARLALAAAFLVATPTLFVGVLRTENVAERAARLSEYDDYWKQILERRIVIKDLDLALRTYMTEREFENGQAAILASKNVSLSITQLVRMRPAEIDLGPDGFFSGMSSRLERLIVRTVADRRSMARARLSVMSLLKELKSVEKNVIKIAKRERKAALASLSTVGRDQLILFLILLFAIPIFVGFVPGWLVTPINRLKQIASKIELGQLREMAVSGRDEVAVLARSLKTYFLRKEELDQKKSSKIFELRNILRSVINRVNEPVFIVDENTKINYTNDSAAKLIGLPSHQMEGKCISDCMYSPVVKEICEKAMNGDVPSEPLPINIEVSDGRAFFLKANIGLVRNRDGDVSRAVLVLYQGEAA